MGWTFATVNSNANRFCSIQVPISYYDTNFEKSKCLFIVDIVIKWQLCVFQASQRELGVLLSILEVSINSVFIKNLILNLKFNFEFMWFQYMYKMNASDYLQKFIYDDGKYLRWANQLTCFYMMATLAFNELKMIRQLMPNLKTDYQYYCLTWNQ